MGGLHHQTLHMHPEPYLYAHINALTAHLSSHCPSILSRWSLGVMLWEMVDGALPKWAYGSWYALPMLLKSIIDYLANSTHVQFRVIKQFDFLDRYWTKLHFPEKFSKVGEAISGG